MAPVRKSTKPLSSSSSSKSPFRSAMKQPTPSASRTKKIEESAFPSSKQDKRRIKHSALISKITKSSSSTKGSNARRRRRPNKKLVTALDSLADALPDDDEVHEEGKSGTAVAGGKPGDQINLIRRKSIKSRPGAMKRKEKLDQGERERFAKNMAQMADSRAQSGRDLTAKYQSQATESAVTAAANPTSTSTAHKWAALRGFISQTLEQNPEIKNAKT